MKQITFMTGLILVIVSIVLAIKIPGIINAGISIWFILGLIGLIFIIYSFKIKNSEKKTKKEKFRRKR